MATHRSGGAAARGQIVRRRRRGAPAKRVRSLSMATAVQLLRCPRASRTAAPPRRALRCRASVAEYTPVQELQASLIASLFRVRPLFKLATAQARSMMERRGASIGVDWAAEVAALEKAADWEAARVALTDTSLAYPPYYVAPFHAYDEGNLSWQAAWEVDAAARCVHAPVFDYDGKILDPEGDAKLRTSYHEQAARLLRGRAAQPVDALDLGCATGLSSRALRQAHPSLRSLTGVDLSPYFLAVGAHLQAARIAAGEASPAIVFRHASAERTGLADASFDLVSMCLVAHELPQAATSAIFAEAYRLLRPGGALQIMEMDPISPILARVRSNPFAFTAFASTEPYLKDYLSFGMEQALEDAGFEAAAQAPNSPRHRTVVAHKPVAL
jgi:ubiquinone/menaquinone biosynthesis C-methylase UbiE